MRICCTHGRLGTFELRERRLSGVEPFPSVFRLVHRRSLRPNFVHPAEM